MVPQLVCHAYLVAFVQLAETFEVSPIKTLEGLAVRPVQAGTATEIVVFPVTQLVPLHTFTLTGQEVMAFELGPVQVVEGELA